MNAVLVLDVLQISNIWKQGNNSKGHLGSWTMSIHSRSNDVFNQASVTFSGAPGVA